MVKNVSQIVGGVSTLRRQRGLLEEPEKQLARLVALGRSHESIARTCNIAPQDVGQAIEVVRQKVGVKTDAALALYTVDYVADMVTRAQWARTARRLMDEARSRVSPGMWSVAPLLVDPEGVDESAAQLLDKSVPLVELFVEEWYKLLETTDLARLVTILRLADDNLTSRELEVIREAAWAKSDKEIAHTLSLSEDTIATHLRHANEKLRLNGNRLSSGMYYLFNHYPEEQWREWLESTAGQQTLVGIRLLSHKERKTLELLVDPENPGRSNAELGQRLFVAEGTIKTRVRAIARKLSVPWGFGRVLTATRFLLATRDPRTLQRGST